MAPQQDFAPLTGASHPPTAGNRCANSA